MTAAVAWSYHLLDAADRRACRRLGVLPGRFPIGAATEVIAGCDDSMVRSDDALAAVARLVDKSLLLRADGSLPSTCTLYHMLETVRAYAASELTAAGERDEALEGLVRYCAREARLATDGLVGPAQVEWLDRVREDLDSYRAALAWLIERERGVDASDIACGLLTFWVVRGYVAEGLAWYRNILDRTLLPPVAESRTRVAAGLTWYTQGELEHARAAVERGLALAPRGSDMVAVGEIVLGHVEHGMGNLAEARDRFTRSLDAFRTLGIPWGVGHALTGLAEVAIEADVAEAERLLDEATPMLRQGGPFYLCLALCGRAMLAVQRGDPDQAIALVRESLPHIRALHDKFAFMRAMAILAAAVALRGDHAWAARLLGVYEMVAERTGATLVGHVRDLRERTESAARDRLGPDGWARAHGGGRAASIDALIHEIDTARIQA
jgi:tetratricopeptide (TPR) repeat protein